MEQMEASASITAPVETGSSAIPDFARDQIRGNILAINVEINRLVADGSVVDVETARQMILSRAEKFQESNDPTQSDQTERNRRAYRLESLRKDGQFETGGHKKMTHHALREVAGQRILEVEQEQEQEIASGGKRRGLVGALSRLMDLEWNIKNVASPNYDIAFLERVEKKGWGYKAVARAARDVAFWSARRDFAASYMMFPKMRDSVQIENTDGYDPKVGMKFRCDSAFQMFDMMRAEAREKGHSHIRDGDKVIPVDVKVDYVPEWVQEALGQGWKRANLVQNGGGKPSGYEEDGKPSGYEEDGKPSGYEEDGKPSGYEEDGKPSGYEEDGKPSGYEEDGKPSGYEEDGKPSGYEEDGKSSDYEEDEKSNGYESDKFSSEGEISAETVKERIQSQLEYIGILRDKYKLDSDNPAVVRALSRLNGLRSGYFEELSNVARGLSAMDLNCELSVVIPAYNESGRIRESIESWAVQMEKATGKPIDFSKLEIIILMNRPNENRPFDDTDAVIESMRQESRYNGMQIHVVQKTFNFDLEKDINVEHNGQGVRVPKGVRMGTIYKYGADLVVLRNLMRLNQSGVDRSLVANHMMRTGGADVYGRNPEFFATIEAAFDNPTVEQYTSRSDFPPSIYRKLPLLHVSSRLNEMMNLLLTRGGSHIGLGTYRASLYAESGGFDFNVGVAEEMDLSRRMRSVLNTRPGSRIRSSIVNAVDDPRRVVNAVLKGYPVNKAYSLNFEDQSIRDLRLEDVVNMEVPNVAELTKENLERNVRSIFEMYLQIHASGGDLRSAFDLVARNLKLSLSVLGLENYSISVEGEFPDSVDDLLKILKVDAGDLTKLQGLVETYRQTEKDPWQEGRLAVPLK